MHYRRKNETSSPLPESYAGLIADIVRRCGLSGLIIVGILGIAVLDRWDIKSEREKDRNTEAGLVTSYNDLIRKVEDIHADIERIHEILILCNRDEQK